jgi:hypothetical protein
MRIKSGGKERKKIYWNFCTASLCNLGMGLPLERELREGEHLEHLAHQRIKVRLSLQKKLFLLLAQ